MTKFPKLDKTDKVVMSTEILVNGKWTRKIIQYEYDVNADAMVPAKETDKWSGNQ